MAVRRLSLVCLTLCCIISSVAGAEFTDVDKPFEDAGADSEVSFISSDRTNTRISMPEEKQGVVKIAIIHYEADETEGGPQITSFDENKNNIMLGAEPLKENGIWYLTITKPQDYENPLQQKYDFYYNTGASGLGHRVSLVFTNINDNVPVIQPLDTNCTVQENYVGLSTCRFLVTDADEGDIKIMTYSVLDGSSTTSLFGISAGSISGANEQEITLEILPNGLDYEAFILHILSISAKDDPVPSAGHTQSISYVVQVGDEPDTSPVWTSAILPQTFDEEEEASFKIEATDGDFGIHATINYELEEGAPSYFSIDASTGVISVGIIDRDVLESDIFRFKAFAYEEEDTNSRINADLIVIINDINDNIPTIKTVADDENFSVTIPEQTAVALPISIVIRDPDLVEAGQFNMELRDESNNNWNEHFLLIPTNGYQKSDVTISVRDPAKLDFENPIMRMITLQLYATEVADNTHIEFKNIIINLEDLNDEYPQFALEEYQFPVEENVKMSTFIGTVLATDLDANDVVKHSLTSQNKILSIDQISGVITSLTNDAFDYERQTEVIVQVMAEDLVQHKTYVQLIISVTDINDEAPSLSMPATQPSVEEVVVVGTPIEATILASDLDTTARLEFSIDWSSSIATKQGARVLDDSLFKECIGIATSYPDPLDTSNAEASLTVLLQDNLDYEIFDTITLSIVVTDLETHADFIETKATRSALLSIALIDKNDNEPLFTSDAINAVRSVIELSGTDLLIGSCVATDIDGPGYNTIVYSIIEMDELLPKKLVKIDPDKGELRVDLANAISCDEEYLDKMSYKVTASDGKYDTDLNIVINIIDLNNQIPQIEMTIFEVPILEHSPTDTYITTASATDKDFSIPYHTISYFINSNILLDLFAIDEITGVLTVNLNEETSADLERDYGITFYDIPILFRDNYQQVSSALSLTNTTTVRVTLVDINDNSPVFPQPNGCLSEPFEDVSAESLIVNGLEATDIDEGKNAEITYSILDIERVVDGNPIDYPPNLFRIETRDNKAYIYNTADLLNIWGEYRVLIEAKDQGIELQNSATETYSICIIDINDNDPVIVFPTSSTIRLKDEQIVGTPLITAKGEQLKPFTATDSDFGDNALVEFSIAGQGNSEEYFEIEMQATPNTGQLLLKKDFGEVTVFRLDVVATDKGTPPRQSSVSFNLYFVPYNDVEPEFQEATQLDTTTFTENILSGELTIKTATDLNNNGIDPSDEEWNDIYYYIIDDQSPGVQFFELDSVTGILTLTQLLDREEYATHVLHILTTNYETKPPNTVVDPNSLSQLVLTIEVVDVNDCPPKFIFDIWPGGISTTNINGYIVTTLEAIDPDVDDEVTYILLPNTMEISDPSLANIKDSAFSLHEKTGEIELTFNPDNSMAGYFKFNVEAHDLIGGEGHMDTTEVKIFIITESNRVTYKFLNNKEDIDLLHVEIVVIFSDVTGYSCSIDTIFKATDSSGIVIEGETNMITHFINTVENEPVPNSLITEIMNNRDKMNELRRQFLNLEPPLDLADYNAGNDKVAQSLEALLRIVLIVVSVVLGSLVIILFAAFCIKTRSLNRRLEALSTTKFGSQDSGLNRVGMNVPGANKHAIEGSNPVWNEEIGARDYDNISQASFDSDLIGVEENPEFNTTSGTANAGYQSDASVRPTLNPLSGGERGLSHQVSIDSQVDDDDFTNNAANSNFSFAKRDESVPVTEL